ncbi:NACHT domain-containing NTPase [Leptolyngbyaceae cyanobacterium UHCC 1019]
MPSTLQTEDNFDEVEKRFDLKRLKRDLEKKSLHPITDAPWRYFKGVLCVGDPAKVAKRCFKSSGNVRDSLNKYVKPYLLEVLNLPEQRIVWERVAGCLCDAGYGNLDQRFSLSINWLRVCGEMLKMQQKQLLMSQPLGSGSRRVADVYVRLGLVERKQNEQPRIAPHDAADRWSVLEQEKTTPISHEDFLERVLQPGKPIAIIGEAGAGKTTLLQHIAEEVQGENTKGLPIWIDLADLEPKETLESYLLKKWLKAVLPIIQEHFPEAVPDLHNSSKDLQKSLIEEINQGRVWLLLNGVDEMVTAIRQPLRWILEQYQQGWTSKARIVLTCRLNVWSSDGERLTNVFEVYRNLDFEPEDVEKFIHKWFLGESERDSLDNLKAELERSNERIKSLIRNPLRLTLLCLTWQKGGDKLPDTKAGLYQRFVDWHYRWNEEKCLTEEEQNALVEQREELDRQLGELSKFALDEQESRFRLRESTVKQFLGNPKQKGSLFWWALRLNWLAPIGLPTASEKDADELVYAFFHPTFQEYFAALAIDDWCFFLNQNKGNYHVFENQWKEIILLWVGRRELAKETKKKLVESLFEFEENCGDYYFYWSKLFTLVFLSMNETDDFDQMSIKNTIENILRNPDMYSEIKTMPAIRKRILPFDFDGYMNQGITLHRKGYLPFLDSFASKEMLFNSINCFEKAEELIEKLAFNHDIETRRQSVKELITFAINNSDILSYLIEKLDAAEDENICCSIVCVLGIAAPGNLEVAQSLANLMQKRNTEIIHISVVVSLCEVLRYKALLKNELLIMLVQKFKDYLEIDPDSYWLYGEVLYHCAQNMSYPEFYEAWHSPLLDVSETYAVGDE